MRAAPSIAGSESLSAPNPPWQRLVRAQEVTAAFLCNAPAVCRSSRERGAADEGLDPSHHCRVFTGHSWISRSQVGVKCHPALTTESPPCKALSGGTEAGDGMGRAGQAEPRAEISRYPGHRCGSPNPASSFPALAGIPHCRELPGQSLPSLPPALPAALQSISLVQACCWSRPGLPWQRTLSRGTRAGSSHGPCDVLPSRKDAVVSISSLFSGRGGSMGLGAFINVYSTGRWAKTLT